MAQTFESHVVDVIDEMRDNQSISKAKLCRKVWGTNDDPHKIMTDLKAGRRTLKLWEFYLLCHELGEPPERVISIAMSRMRQSKPNNPKPEQSPQKNAI